MPCFLHGNKGFGPVWGTALYTMLRLLYLVPGFPLLSWLLHHAWPHVTTRDAVAQRVSPFLTHAANSPACLPLPSLGALSLCCCFRLPVFCWFVCFVSWCGSLFGRAVPTEANTVNILGPQP
jgi:hypothetical protein